MIIGSDVWGGEVECPRRSGNLKGVDVGCGGEVGCERREGRLDRTRNGGIGPCSARGSTQVAGS